MEVVGAGQVLRYATEVHRLHIARPTHGSSSVQPPTTRGTGPMGSADHSPAVHQHHFNSANYFDTTPVVNPCQDCGPVLHSA